MGRDSTGQTDTQAEAAAKLINRVFAGMQVRCPAWKNAVTRDSKAYVGSYKAALLESLIRGGVVRWDQIETGLNRIKSDFLPNPDKFVDLCLKTDEITGSAGTGAHRIYRHDRRLEGGRITESGQAAGRAAMREAMGR